MALAAEAYIIKLVEAGELKMRVRQKRINLEKSDAIVSVIHKPVSPHSSSNNISITTKTMNFTRDSSAKDNFEKQR